MISIIAGPKGSGKTKRLISMANEDVQNLSGNVIFVDDDKRHIYDLKHDLRFISMDEYPLKNVDEFFGFLCGIVSNDYDINKIYIDGLFKVMETNHEQLPQFISKLRNFAESSGIEFIMTISCTKDELREELKEFVV